MSDAIRKALDWATGRDEQLRIERGMDRGERMAVLIRETRILYSHQPDVWRAVHDALNPEVPQMRANLSRQHPQLSETQ